MLRYPLFIARNRSCQLLTIKDLRYRTLSTNNPKHSVTKVEEIAQKRAVRVTWNDDFTAIFHKKWLRDHCTCPVCLHPETLQRQVDTASIPVDPPITSLSISKTKGVAISWNKTVYGTTCRESHFDPAWLRKHAYQSISAPYPKSYKQQTLNSKCLWDGSLLLPRHKFTDAMKDLKPVMSDVYKYGLVVIDQTPPSMEETEAFSRKIGFVLETIYGRMWTTNPQTEEQEYNDTASTNAELLHHTDGTYLYEPPGLQIFNCIAQANQGGESRYIDGFHVVEKLRRTCQQAFEFLSTTPLHYHHFDQDAHLSTMEPIIKLDHAQNIIQIRHNDYDRAPLTHLSSQQVEKFYQYHEQLMTIMREPSMELVRKLQVGEMMIVDNQRVLHARSAFQGGNRALIGCYIGRTEYESRLRVLGII